jgi:hypothetical protein
VHCRRAAGVLTSLLLALVALAACGARTRAPGDLPLPVGPARFPHDARAHATMACTACHAEADVRAGRPARPGRDHAPCDGAGCHREAFMRAPGDLCLVCHADVEPGAPGESPLAPFPGGAGARARPAAFSHALHLDRARLDRASGFHVACDDCHARGPDDSDYGMPGHAACLRCHADEGSAPRVDDCRGCHDPGLASQPRERQLVRGDAHFRHVNHEVDRRGRAVACVTCHGAVGAKRRADTRATPELAACVSCHDDARRTPEAFAMRRCATCHTEAASGALSLVAPRSHLPPRDRPDSHTLAFRKDHGADARRDPAACATCHTGLSGGRDNCDECHQVMRPNDHFVGFAEQHGSETSADATRCATCHAGDFCTTCHARRAPRSHLPLGQFRDRGHAAPARAGMASCLTCHDPPTDCAGSLCHGALP